MNLQNYYYLLITLIIINHYVDCYLNYDHYVDCYLNYDHYIVKMFAYLSNYHYYNLKSYFHVSCFHIYIINFHSNNYLIIIIDFS